MQYVPVVFLLALGAGTALTWVVRGCAQRIGLLDRPGAHKQHGEVTPTLGGIAIFAALLLASWFSPLSTRAWTLLQVAGLVTLVGAVDDVRGVRATYKLLVLGLAACLLCQGGWPCGGPLPFPFNWIVSFLWVGLVSSAFNGVDNADGAAGGLTLVSSLLCLIVGASAGGHAESLILAAALGGACLGFLVFNFPRPRATIFLGDSGSLLIGLVMSCLAVDISPVRGWASFSFAALLLAVPLFDFSLILMLRGMKGQYRRWSDPITMCARDHTFHRLVAFGLSGRAAVLWMYLAALASGGGAAACWALWGAPGISLWIGASLTLALLAGVLFDQAPLAEDVYAAHRSVR